MTWYFYGCADDIGHQLKRGGDARTRDVQLERLLESFDDLLRPRYPDSGELNVPPYKAALSRLSGLKMSALSWVDPSVDRRPGSNAIVWCPSVSAAPETIYQGLARFFPEVERRFRRTEIVTRVTEEEVVGIPLPVVIDRRVWIPSVNFERHYFVNQDNQPCDVRGEPIISND